MGLYNPMNGEVISCSHGVSGSPLGMNPGGIGPNPVARTNYSPKLIGKILMKNLLRRQKDYGILPAIRVI